jgi:hypothetical protein
MNSIIRRSAHKTTLTRRGFIRAAGLAAAGLVAAACQPASNLLPAAPAFPSVLGVGRGIHPGRVVWVHNPAAAAWDGQTGFWWQEAFTPLGPAAEMLSHGLRSQTGQNGDAAAWQALFAHFNARRGRSGAGYAPGEKIAIKVNVNNCDRHAYADNGSFTAPSLVLALLQQLVGQAGVPAAAITVYDALRCIPDAIYQLCALPELAGVHFVDWSGGEGREQQTRDPDVQVHWSADVQGSPTYLPTCLTGADYLINLAGLKGHNLAGVTLTAKNHFGSILSDLQGEPTRNAPQGANIHATVAAHDFDIGPDWKWPQRPMGTYTALADLIAHPHLGQKTLLFILDGLYPALHQSAKVTPESKWQSAPFNGAWAASLMLSQDGVALDSVGYDFLSSEPVILAQKDVLAEGHSAQNFLHEASQADKPPSGTRYDPARSGVQPASLGVHDHWNNPEQKQYARNLGSKEGIEQVKVA